MIDSISSQEVDQAISTIDSALSENLDKQLLHKLRDIKTHLQEMKVAVIEADMVESQHERGNITTDHFFDIHKKYVTDFIKSRDSIIETDIPSIQELQNQNLTEKVTLRSLLRDNKNFLLNLGMFVMDLVKLSGIH